ncbi:MAG: alpha/beta fold hydrolase [Myxococcales bacterium]|nr:alpha/beta fold hydrolase [Myxococcales bacterium]
MLSSLRSLFLAALVSLLVACSGSTSTGNTAPIDAPDALGPNAVGHSSFTAIDSARAGRSLLVDVWYPIDDEDAADSPVAEYLLLGPLGLASEVAVEGLPVSSRANQTLLVFSHGYGGIQIQSFGLMEALASHGFIVISPEHTGNAQSSVTPDSFDEAAANRVPDVSFLIDTMFDRNDDPQDAFYQRIDESAVGVVGHSFGGMTAVGMAAGWAGAPADPRVAAIAPISAVIDGGLQSDDRPSPNAGFTREQLESIIVPVMLMGGTEDTNVPIGNNAIAFEQIVNAPQVYKVDIIGANHNHFAAICAIANWLLDRGWGPEIWPDLGAEALIEPYEATCGPDVLAIEEANRLQNLYVVSFFKLHLRNVPGYARFLTSEFADMEPGVTVTVK